ncbi:hypothetical protein [uncultured Gimesia sp.]|nr:hypothetical protein [uncultured Gimesia sp.]
MNHSKAISQAGLVKSRGGGRLLRTGELRLGEDAIQWGMLCCVSGLGPVI